MNIAEKIDHTMLKADATTAMIKRYCDEAKTYGFASVCVNSCHASLVALQLRGSGIHTCCVVGFPLGAMLTAAKAFEASEAVKEGADEIDMVINVGALKDKNWDFVKNDIAAVVEASKPSIVKVIIETCLLTEEEKVKACVLAEEANAAFVKTSTGFSTKGATIEDIQRIKKTVGDRLQIKASGSIRTAEFAEELIAAGANRIGAGNGVILLNKIQEK
jgi:deoxyribose-phosphate aldolase